MSIENDTSESRLSISSDIDEIPVWIRSKQRWISGLTKDTTCGQLVDVLLRDEGLITNDGATAIETELLNQYVITERWRRVEQILDNSTKILKIWTSWGEEQSEVRLSLRRIEYNPSSYNHHHHHRSVNKSILSANNPTPGDNTKETKSSSKIPNIVDKDSSTDSSRSSNSSSDDDSDKNKDQSTLRRKRHCSLNPKTSSRRTNASQKATNNHKPAIEKLMKLILEQGETIQQQLTQLRDKELQINTIEQPLYNTHYNTAGKEDSGKNYLLETYLNGIHHGSSNGDDTNNIISKEPTNGNSDSGVHTEDATTSPEVGISPTCTNQNDDEYNDNVHIKNGTKPSATFHQHKRLSKKNASTTAAPTKRNQHHQDRHPKRNYTTSKRETKLLKDHESNKEFLTTMKYSFSIPDAGTADTNNDNDDDDDDGNDESEYIENEINVHHQVVALQKLVTINKHLQREEELLIRLMAKVGKYKCDMTDMSALQIHTAIKQVNENIDSTSIEIQRMEMEIENFGEQLSAKSEVLNRLSKELEEMELTESGVCQNEQYPYNLPNHVILSQAPLYFKKDDDCSISTVNLHCDQRNVNKFAATGLDNAKVGPKKLINEYCKDQDLFMYANGDEEFPLLGTLV